VLKLVVALPAEARPIIDHFGLRATSVGSPFSLFSNDNMTLILSGIGKVAAAAATATLYAATGGGRQAGWLNIGIAGHPSLPMGTARLVNKVQDQSSGRSWYPPPVLAVDLARESLLSVDKVERTYASTCLYEMEAAGFYPTACRFSTAELVHCFKVVSDGPAASPETLTPASVRTLMAGALQPLESVVRALGQLATEAQSQQEEPADYQDLLSRFHFTVSESRTLRRILQRRRALAPATPLPNCEIATLGRGRAVNKVLENWLNSLPVTF
jgi:hypothetical protein